MKKILFNLLVVFGGLLFISCFSLKDKIINRWLRMRYKYYRIVAPSKLNDSSSLEKKGYTLILNETFDSVSWNKTGDKNNWKIGGSNLYHPSHPNVYYGPPELRDGGYAAFTAKYNPKKIYMWQTGETHEFPYEVSKLFSHSFIEQQYGRFECRMTLPNAKHSWPAFWLWGRPWPPEIDVIEAYGRETGEDIIYQEINLHWGEGENPQQMGAWKIKIDKVENIGNNFYEFVVEWRPDRVDFYTNGVKVFQFTDKKILSKWFNQPMWVVVNNSIRHAGIEELGENYYSEFLVDYVRIYQFKK